MKKDSMTTRERFRAVMNFQSFDRLPVVEWAPWWGKTIERWHGEGLPPSLEGYDINRHFGLDVYICIYVQCLKAVPDGLEEKVGVVSDMDDYVRARQYLYPWPIIDREWWQAQAEAYDRGEVVLLCEPPGYFFFARDLLGIEEHLLAFYDHPELLHAINADLADYHLRIFEELCTICRPDLVSFAEDMSYNHGPMLSKVMFDEFMRPYYERVVPRLKDYGLFVIVDSDGDITEPAGWFQAAGVEGMLPLEHQAGVDVCKLRRMYPDMRYIGCFDKMTMNRGETAMRAEFERLLPVAREGGLVIGCDHQTPPGVSLQDYELYLRLFREYAFAAAQRV